MKAIGGTNGLSSLSFFFLREEGEDGGLEIQKVENVRFEIGIVGDARDGGEDENDNNDINCDKNKEWEPHDETLATYESTIINNGHDKSMMHQ